MRTQYFDPVRHGHDRNVRWVLSSVKPVKPHDRRKCPSLLYYAQMRFSTWFVLILLIVLCGLLMCTENPMEKNNKYKKKEDKFVTNKTRTYTRGIPIYIYIYLLGIFPIPLSPWVYVFFFFLNLIQF